MKIEETELKGLWVITPEAKTDRRGEFFEAFRSDVFASRGIDARFAQVNQSVSGAGVLRGLHFQWDPPLGKLMRAVRGAAWMVCVDIRRRSPTLGQWVGLELTDDDKKLIFAPPGFATGFCVVGDLAAVEYLYTALYNPAGEGVILWNDPALAIPWPVMDPILSDRDAAGWTLEQWLGRPEAERV